jgi:hypothetical protein
MAKVVAIPKVAPGVQFPEHFSDQDVQNTVSQLHDAASKKEIANIVAFVADNTPAQKISEHLKIAHTIATILETFPALAHIAGIGLKTSGLNR